MSSDPLAMAAEAQNRKPIRLEPLEADENAVLEIIESARPFRGRRLDTHYMALARQWWTNLCYYIGIQGFEVTPAFADIDPMMIATDGGYVANHILRLVQGSVARLVSAKIDWSVIPNTPDQVDQDGAKVAQHLLDFLVDKLDLTTARTELAMWLDVCGTAYYYDAWDPSVGQVRRTYTDPFSGTKIAPQQMGPGQQQWLDQLGLYTDENDGDHDFEVMGPFDVWMPVRFKKLKMMPWVLIRRTMSLERVFDKWPDKAELLPIGETNEMRLENYRNRLPMLSRRPGLQFTSASENDGAVDVDEFWYPPSKRCPTGMYIAASNRTLLEFGPHKFAAAGIDRRFPIIDCHNIRVPGRFHSMSTVEHLIGPQTEYNKARQQIIQHRDTLSVPQWMAPVGCIAKGAVRNEFGDLLEYNAVKGTPTLVQPPGLGDAQLVSGQQATSDMQMISSFSDASLGQMPQGARSANTISSLAERDVAGVTPTVQGLETSHQELGRHFLVLEWKFRTQPQAIQIYGESRQADVRYFRGVDLNGNTAVVVKPGSMTPRSRAQTEERITRLIELGALNPADPAQHRLILDSLEVGGTDRLWLMLDGNRRRARIENSMFSKPSPDPNFSLPQVNQYDDHPTHYEEHHLFMLTDEYELLHPVIKQLFLAHIQQHVQAMAKVIEAQAVISGAQQMGGAPPGGMGQGNGGAQARPLGKPSPPRQTSRPSVAQSA